jgi:hypothetical protein
VQCCKLAAVVEKEGRLEVEKERRTRDTRVNLSYDEPGVGQKSAEWLGYAAAGRLKNTLNLGRGVDELCCDRKGALVFTFPYITECYRPWVELDRGQ